MAAGPPTDGEFFNALIGPAKLNQTPNERGIVPNSLVKLYVWDSENKKAIWIASASVEEKPGTPKDAEPTLRTQLHGHTVKENMIVLRNFVIGMNPSSLVKAADVKYPYTFDTTDDPITTLGQLTGNISFVWDLRAMLHLKEVPVTRSTRSTRSSSTGTSRAHEIVIRPAEKEVVIKPVSADLVNAVTSLSTVLKTVDLTSNDENQEKANDGTGEEFTRKEFRSSEYGTIRMRVKISQINDFETPLRQRKENFVDELVTLFTDERVGFDTSKGMLWVTSMEKDIGTARDALSGIVAAARAQAQNGIYTLPDAETVTIVDGRHRREAITRVSKMNGDKYNWSRDYIEVVFKYRLDMQIISSWEVLMLSSNANTITATVYEANTVVDILKTIESYSIVFEAEYKVNYINAKSSLVLDDMMRTMFLGQLAETTVIRYIRCSKAFFKYQDVKNFLYTDCKFASETRGKVSNVQYIQDAGLLNAKEHDMLYMLRCADAFYKSRPGEKFYPKEFYNICSLGLHFLELYNRCVQLQETRLAVPPTKPKTLVEFMNTKIKSTGTIFMSPLESLMNILKTFKHVPTEPAKGASIMKRSYRLLAKKICTFYGVDDPATTEPPRVPKDRPERPPSSRIRDHSTIDLTDENAPTEPPKKKPNTRRGKFNPKNKPKPPTKPVTRSNSGRGRKPSTSLSATESTRQTEDHKFDDSIDVDVVPAGYEERFRYMKDEFNQKIDLSLEDVLMMRRFPNQRDRREEMDLLATRTITIPADQNNLGEDIVDVSGYLRAICIPENHRAHLFVSFSCIRLYRNLACMWGIYGEAFKKGGVYYQDDDISENLGENWERARDLLWTLPVKPLLAMA